MGPITRLALFDAISALRPTISNMTGFGKNFIVLIRTSIDFFLTFSNFLLIVRLTLEYDISSFKIVHFITNTSFLYVKLALKIYEI